MRESPVRENEQASATPLLKLEGMLQRIIRQGAQRHLFLLTCGALALAGTVSAGYPVAAVVVSASLMAPRRWLSITATTAIGSAVGATILVIVFHHLGWGQIYDRFPQLASDASWQKVLVWTSEFGIIAVFAIALSPLPQTPALIFFAIVRHDYVWMFFAMLAGKSLKYGLFAWLSSRFPQRFRGE